MTIEHTPSLIRRASLAILVAVVACGGAATTPAASSATRPITTTSRASVLTLDEIQKAHLSTVYDVVSSLRPRWLQTRGTDSFQHPTEVQVYVGNTRMTGGVSSLRDISALGVTKLEFVDGISASARWGLDHGAGAIVVWMSTDKP